MIFIQVAGHLGQDPEVRYTPSGLKVTTLRVATNIKRGGKEKTVWWKVTLWGDRFDKKVSYLKKGSPIFAWGEMGIPDIYNDREGNPQTNFEIIGEYIGFNPFGQKDRNQEGGQGQQGEEEEQPSGRFGTKTQGSRAAPVASSGAFDDDVPF